jgi:acyl dehydratase
MNPSAFDVPNHPRYFEDYVPGSIFEFGTSPVDGTEVHSFAQRFDPQAIHIDAEVAARGPFGGSIASGWHTAGLMMRLYVTHYLSDASSLGSPGVDELRWIQPVRAGDILRIRLTVLEARRSRSKPDRGMVRTFVEVLNQKDDVVMSLKAMNMIRCKETT